MAYKPETIAYTEQQMRVADFAKALAHPARIAIIELLYQRGGCFCGDIVEVLPLAQSSVSQHLRDLREAGLITATDMPPKVKYCLNQDNWLLAKQFFCAFFEKN